MRILIDLQCAQRESWKKGAGEYVLSFLDAVWSSAKAEGHEVHLLLNAALPTSIPSLQRRFKELHAARQIHVFQGLDDNSPNAKNALWRAQVSGHLRDMAIVGLSPDAIFCPKIFEIDREGIAPYSTAVSHIPVIRMAQDLHLLLKSEIRVDHDLDVKALSKANIADALLCTSEATRRTVQNNMPYLTTNVHVVTRGVDPCFVPPDTLSLNEIIALRRRYGLMRPYLLCGASWAPHKPLAPVVKSYARLPRHLIDRYDLVIAGELTATAAEELQALAQHHALDRGSIHLLDRVSETDLPALCGLASLFVQPFLCEGSGQMALQAIRCGTLVLGADTGNLPEVIGTPEALFDPTDASQLTEMITLGLTEAAHRDALQARQSDYAAQFSWARSAQETVAIFNRYAHETAIATGWVETQARLDNLEENTLMTLEAVFRSEHGITHHDLEDTARAVSQTRLALDRAWRPRTLPSTGLLWRLEGPFDSSYSLASVNRETARSLMAKDVNVALVSAEGDGPFSADPAFLEDRPDLAAQQKTGQNTTEEDAHILSRNMYPPRVADMRGPLNLLHGYAWEETGLPLAFSRDMSSHLQGLLVTSPHVKKIFEDAGIGLPIHIVGNGVDHLDVEPTTLPMSLPEAGFTLLHVSSCLPRKGADVLLACFAEAFGVQDDVALVIKSFPNPHNTIHDQIAAVREAHFDLPPIMVIEEELSPGAMRSLYKAADLLVAPSRAEGFCLPVAEAVMAGTPALTTGWGGQRVFDGNPMVHFCDYSFTPAESHLETYNSVWAEPDREDLVRQLRHLRTAVQPDVSTRKSAANQITRTHNWNIVAERSLSAARSIAEMLPTPPPKVGWISSYNTRCGIATYSGHLIKYFPDQVTVFASHADDLPMPDGIHIRRCWRQDGQDPLVELQAEVDLADPEVLVIQFNYGFFGFPQLGALILRAKEDGRKVVVMMHATDESAVPPLRRLAGILPALRTCDKLLVHSHHDLNNLRALGLEENVALFPHGVPFLDPPKSPVKTSDRPVTLGTYGFFLPPKGLVQLIEAVALLRDGGESVALEMINAEYPAKVSTETIALARDRIDALGLNDRIQLETRFLEDDESFARLANADALVFPYQNTAESASGAVRQALALNRPVITTPLRIFDDVASLTLRLPGNDPAAIAAGLKPLIRALRDPASEPETTAHIKICRENIHTWRRSHAYQVLAPRLWRQICSL
jgi:glycosyltransferase involved in cell wall biosynthesis